MYLSNRQTLHVSTESEITGQLADATGDFACLVFVFLVASARLRDRELTSPRDVQSASWRIRELSSYQH